MVPDYRGIKIFIMTRLLSIYSFCLLVTTVLCSYKKLNEELKKELKTSISQNFYPAITQAAEKNELFAPLLTLTVEIDSLFLERKKVKDSVFDSLVDYVKLRIDATGAKNSTTADDLLKIFTSVCEECKSKDKAKRDLLKNQKTLQIMADICFDFKAPVHWLFLTSKVLGQPDLFKDAPVLLESIRKAFLGKFDPKIDSIDFEEKLNVIKISFDFYLSQCQPDSEASFNIYKELKTEFLKQIDAVIENLTSSSNSFSDLSTGLGKMEIGFDLGSNLRTTNEDLWDFIIFRIENIREEIESTCPNLLKVNEKSIIDLIISNIRLQSQNFEPFTLKKSHKTIKKSFDDYMNSIENSLNQESLYISILNIEVENMKMIFEAALKQFTEELHVKINEVKSKYGFIHSEKVKIDLSRIATSLMASEALSITKS